MEADGAHPKPVSLPTGCSCGDLDVGRVLDIQKPHRTVRTWAIGTPVHRNSNLPFCYRGAPMAADQSNGWSALNLGSLYRGSMAPGPSQTDLFGMEGNFSEFTDGHDRFGCVVKLDRRSLDQSQGVARRGQQRGRGRCNSIQSSRI